jgi:hypothetical protein
MARINIRWGHVKEGYLFGTNPNNRSDKKHLVAAEPHNYTSACGIGVAGTSEFARGWLCAACAKAVDIKSPDDFDILQDEYDWGLANHGGDD